jgi:plasmid replication initiation protein
MGAENYKTWQSFKERALLPAINEINQFSNKNLEYNVIKRGRSVIAVELLISSKDSIEALRIRSDIEKEFGYDQLTLWDQLKDGGYIK